MSMKNLLLPILVMCCVSQAIATRQHTPHKEKIEVTYTSGDKVTFLTRYNTVKVIGLYVTSRNGIQYTIPTNFLHNIKRPKIETVELQFQVLGGEYEEGAFSLRFYHGTTDCFAYGITDQNEQTSSFTFEKGMFFDSSRSMIEYEEKHNQKLEPTVETPVE